MALEIGVLCRGVRYRSMERHTHPPASQRRRTYLSVSHVRAVVSLSTLPATRESIQQKSDETDTNRVSVVVTGAWSHPPCARPQSGEREAGRAERDKRGRHRRPEARRPQQTQRQADSGGRPPRAPSHPGGRADPREPKAHAAAPGRQHGRDGRRGRGTRPTYAARTSTASPIRTVPGAVILAHTPKWPSWWCRSVR